MVEVEAVLAREAGRAPACNTGSAGCDLAQGTTAPCLMLSASLGTTRSASNSSFSPRPSQAGQAPCGALKQNSRGSISAMVKPETGQANFSEKTMRLGGVGRAFMPPTWASSPRARARRIGQVDDRPAPRPA